MCIHLSGYITDDEDVIHFPGLVSHERIYKRWLDGRTDHYAVRYVLFGRTSGMEDPRRHLLAWEVALSVPVIHFGEGSALEGRGRPEVFDFWAVSAPAHYLPNWADEPTVEAAAKHIAHFHEQLLNGGDLAGYALHYHLQPDSEFWGCLREEIVPEKEDRDPAEWFTLWERPENRIKKWRELAAI